MMRSCSPQQKSTGGLNSLFTRDCGARPLRRVACRTSSSDTALQKRIMATLDKQLEQRPSISVSLDDYRIVGNIDTSAVPESLKKDCILFYTPETEPLARKVAQEGSHVQLGNIRWKCFPDGFPDLFVHNAMHIRNRHVGFLASFHDPGKIFEQISIIYALPRLFIGSFTLVLPFFPTGTAERVETEGDVATAFTLARILSNIPPSRGGPTSIVIFDIHALQERFYFGDGVLPLFESGIPLLLERLKQLPDQEKVTIAYPDEGAWKRFHYQFKDEGYPEVICTKVRDGAKRIVRLKEGEPQGRHVVIVDDLVQSGGTLIECHALLSSLGARHVSAYVTHGVFPRESWNKFNADNGEGAAANGGFRYFWLTDSCPQTSAHVENRKPFEVLTLAGPIAEALQI
eukprot:GHUV01002577.1.p1 GENE.GHUV01002577.1~~GHUV01002577.1.p1  ORF type:complete len:401 (+),score=76.86 GHUV01002577.1:709-1911(+)